MASDYVATVQKIVDDVIAPQAAEIDRTGSFPRAGIDGLVKAGVLGMMSSTDVGGGGQSLAEASAVIEKLAGACGSTAMVVLMHYSATSMRRRAGSPLRARPTATYGPAGLSRTTPRGR